MTRPLTSQILHGLLPLDHLLMPVANVDAMGAVGDGVANDTAILSAAMLAAKTVVLGYGKTYTVDNNFTIPAGTRLLTNGSKLRIRTTSFNPGINVSSNVIIDELAVVVPSGVQSRGVYIRNVINVQIGSISVVATDQQGLSSPTQQALAIDNSQGVRIGSVTIDRYDWPVRLDSNIDLNIGGFSITSYVRGIYVESCNRLHIGASKITIASPNATGAPGNNALLTQAEKSENVDLTFEDFYVANSGEHGIRIGGGNYLTRNVRIVRPTVRETGEAGIKVQAVADGTVSYTRTQNVSITDPIFEDIGPSDHALMSQNTDNYNAMVLKYIDGLTVTNPLVRKRGRTYSAKGGIYLLSVINSKIDVGLIADTKFDGVKIDTNSAGNVDCQDLVLHGGQAILNGQHGINIVYPAWTLRRILIDGVKLTSNVGYGLNIDDNGGTGVINVLHANCVLEANTAGGVANDNAGIVLQMAGQFNAPVIAPRDGSTWLDRVAGTFKVLKAGVWTAI